MNADELELIKLIRTSTLYPDDTAIHSLFPHLRLHGEWFQFEKELETFIEGLDTNGTYQAKTILSYELRIAELEAQIVEQQKRLFRNRQLIEQLTQELGLLQKQYRQIQALQIPASYFSPDASLLPAHNSVENKKPQIPESETQTSFFVHYTSSLLQKYRLPTNQQ